MTEPSYITIILFFLSMGGFGYSLTRWVSWDRPWFEKLFLQFGIGMGVFIVVSTLFTLLRIPLDWKLFFILSIILPLYDSKKILVSLRTIDLTPSKSSIAFTLVLLIAITHFWVFVSGSFSYPWLEDDDPWNHAYAADYVAAEKSALEPYEGANDFKYMDAYPVSYDILMGVLHQTSPSLSWTLKFFNALIISLGLVFFYFFSLRFTGSLERALFSTFALAVIPAYLSHFIWAISLAMTMFFVAMYALLAIDEDWRWKFVAAIIVASLLLIQPTHMVKLGIMLGLYWIVRAIISRSLEKNILAALVFGVIVSLVIWWIPMLVRWGPEFVAVGLSQGDGHVERDTGVWYVGALGSASRPYTWDDYYGATEENMINNPVGIGKMLWILFLFSLFLLVFQKKSLSEQPWKVLVIVWLVFAFFGLNGGTRFWAPVAFISFRFWMIFAVVVALISSIGFSFLLSLARKMGTGSTFAQILVVGLVVFGAWQTSGWYKYQINTSQWGPGGWLADPYARPSLELYVWLYQNTPTNAKVFPFTAVRVHAIGFDKYSCEWCRDVVEFRRGALGKSPSELSTWLKSEGYEYVLLDQMYDREKSQDIAKKTEELATSGLFTPLAKASQGVGVVFKVA